MKNKFFTALAVVLISSSSMADEPTIRFSGDCAAGHADVVNTDVVLYNLNLDLFEAGSSESSRKNCLITTDIPAREGFQVTRSRFKAEAFAANVDGVASLLVDNRFINQRSNGAGDTTRGEDKALVVFNNVSNQDADSCGKAATIITEISVRTFDADLIFEDATHIFEYSPCYTNSD